MGSWVNEFKALNSPTKNKGSIKNNPGLLQPSKAEQIEAELKLLEWHKLANNAAIKVVHINRVNHLPFFRCYLNYVGLYSSNEINSSESISR
jgi:epoxyqueuosine reductase QueG